MLPLLAPDAALFLDIDGTLIEFEDRPEEVRIPPALLATIDALRQALGGALAVVSGRNLADIDRLFAPLVLAAGAQHGAEARLTAGGKDQSFAAPQAALASVADRLAAFLAAHSGIRVERKGLSTAFHYRNAVELGPALRDELEKAVAPVAGALNLLDSHLCYDVRARDADKGKAVERLMAVAPFAGRVPVYIGDDWTDEDGFTAALAAQGRAIRVGTDRPTLATESVNNSAALRQWLDRSLTALRG
ncbi:MAG TPA: trehalose-phosphatase [Stellaceae bacterium]|jgi:trehalose 6-phosphate phosphatase|nr:trehalose-phosphatase [Stellaceae bacterium]